MNLHPDLISLAGQRTYQIDAWQNIFTAWESGTKRILAMSATGTGKTVIFLGVIRQILENEPNARILIIAHRQELIYQPIERAEQFFPDIAKRMGVVMAAEDEHDSQIVVATIQTMKNGRLKRYLDNGYPEYVITDECFPAGTLVDNRPIESLKAGDIISAYDEKTQALKSGKVAHIFKRKTNVICKVKTSAGEIVCTPNHPFLTSNGWKPAGELKNNDTVYIDMLQLQKGVCSELVSDKHLEMQQRTTGLLLQEMPTGILQECNCSRTGGKETCTSPEMPCVQQGVCTNKEPAWSLVEKQQKNSLLLKRMQLGILFPNLSPNNDGDKSQVCFCKFCENESQQSDVPPRNARESKQNSERNGTQAACAWGEWKRPDSGTIYPIQCPYEVVAGMEDGIYLPNQRSEYFRLSANPLQAGHCPSRSLYLYRGGRGKSRPTEAENGRRQENRPIGAARVECVTVYKQGNHDEFERLCPGGIVYNLEVGKYHTYTANGFIVHNCHHGPANSYRALFENLPDAKLLGLTATPKRTDNIALREAGFEKCVFRFSIEKAIAAGALVPPTVMGFRIDAEAQQVMDEDEGEIADLGDLLSADNILEIVFQKWHEFAANRQTIGFTASVAQAHATAAYFRDRGVIAEAIDATTPKEQRADMLGRYKTNRLQVIFNCMVLTEGFDAPETSALIMIAPTKSDLVYLQRMGRGLRTHPGKTDCIVLDFAPLNDRDVVMAGDVLDGLTLSKKEKKLIEKADKQGLLFGFKLTKDGIGEVDPAQIQVEVIDYLKRNRLAWTFDGQCGTVGLSDEYSLALVLPDHARVKKAKTLGRALTVKEQALFDHLNSAKLYLVQAVKKTIIDQNNEPRVVTDHHESNLLVVGEVKEVQSHAEQVAPEYSEGVLSDKSKPWRKEGLTPGQAKFLRTLGADPTGLTKGQAAQRITHLLTMRAVQSAESKYQKEILTTVYNR